MFTTRTQARALEHWNKHVIAVCSTNYKTTASVSVENIDEAEEAAVALALTIATSRTKQATITSDSRTAISNFGDGKVGKAARKILQKKTPQTGSRFSLTWVPGHSGHSGNEEAHALVTRAQQIRATSCRATTDGDHCYGASPYDRGPRAYNDILRSIRMQRKFMGAPHKRLSRTQESTWRRLQLHNTLTPRMLSRIWPDLFSDKCEECGGVEGGWAHTYWMCPSNPILATLQSRLDDQDEDLPCGPPRKRLVVIVKAGQRRGTPTSSVACSKTDGGNANEKGIATNVIPAQSAAPQTEPRRQARIPRPANAFMLFAQEQRRKVAAQHPQENNKRVSTLLGQLWRDLPKDQMELYHQRANDVASEHRQRYPDYVYNPREARQRKAEERRAKQLALELKRSMSASVAERRRQQARVKASRAQPIVKRTKRAHAHPRPVGQADVATALAETPTLKARTILIFSRLR
ncbi:hypothetical protein HPB47_023253 [Ixodes persulcatus]|uniref:Uncharacterized protein n=1 Tax=Ixodes persulcatus TaxID=34615 RepID=A0AC60Q845_IXOPE|nr:hypothetical protein HPB47_023253 [Ixodes persulcatus]